MVPGRLALKSEIYVGSSRTPIYGSISKRLDGVFLSRDTSDDIIKDLSDYYAIPDHAGS